MFFGELGPEKRVLFLGDFRGNEACDFVTYVIYLIEGVTVNCFFALIVGFF